MKTAITTPKKFAIAGVLGLASLTLASTASAVSFIREYRATRLDDGGTTFQEMTAVANTFCYLSGVSIENTDTEGEAAQCRVVRGSVAWRLEANLRNDDDADVDCRAMCHNN